MRRCTGCKQLKPKDAFGKSNRLGHLKTRCYECAATYMRGWYKRNIERVKQAKKSQPSRSYSDRREKRLRKYGISSAEYDAMLIVQGGACSICSSTDPKHWSGRFMVDHCHSTRKVRGLLCATCNTGLGLFSDDSSLLTRAVAYLESNQLISVMEPNP